MHTSWLLIIHVSLASTFVFTLLYYKVAGEPEVVFGHFYPANSGAGEE
jgi:hypothetical protein